ncbi:MAG: ice-binding family protein, partial [Sulfuriferula sp.]
FSSSLVSIIWGATRIGWLLSVISTSDIRLRLLVLLITKHYTSTLFAGNILADQSVTLNTTAKILCGRAIVLNAAVTMDTNTISNDCIGAGAIGSGRSDYGSGNGAGQTACHTGAAGTRTRGTRIQSTPARLR